MEPSYSAGLAHQPPCTLEGATFSEMSLRQNAIKYLLAISRTVIESSDWFFSTVAFFKFSTAVDSNGDWSVDRPSVSFSSSLASYILPPQSMHGFARTAQLAVMFSFSSLAMAHLQHALHEF